MKKFIVITFLLFMAFGCKTMEGTKGVVDTTQKSVMQHKHSRETGTYLKDEGILGFLWYVKIKKLSNDEVVTQGYEFSFLNLSLFIVTIIVIASLRLKKEANLLYDGLNKKTASSKFFRRGMSLFIVLTLVTASIFIYYAVWSRHISIDSTPMSGIILGMMIYVLCIYGYWYFILKYTDISIKQSIDHDDLIITSKHGALFLAVLLIVMLTWFAVIGILSGLFTPLLGVISVIILLFILKERT